MLALVFYKMIRVAPDNHKHAWEVPCVTAWEVLWPQAKFMHLLTHVIHSLPTLLSPFLVGTYFRASRHAIMTTLVACVRHDKAS